MALKNNLTLILISLLVSHYSWAQAPLAFNYQGVARDLTGTALGTKSISVRASILDGSLTGPIVYAETHTIATNQFGLFTLAIGTGTATNGTFATVNWAIGSKYLKIEIDPNGGSSYTLSGTTQLLSVPYAMYAAKAGDSKWSDNNVGINYNDGKVGIGTSNPAWALTIEKNASGADRNFVMLNNTNNGNDATAGLTVQVGTDPTEVLSLGYGGPNYSLVSNSASRANVQSKNLALRATSSTGDISFHVGGFENEKMRINASGRVGIGTTTPSATLHTNGTVRFQGLISNNTLTNALVTDANGNVYTKDISTLGASQWTNVTGGINYSGGRVGIGTTTPIGMLEIANTDYSLRSIELNTVKSLAAGIGFQGKTTQESWGSLYYYTLDFTANGDIVNAGNLILNGGPNGQIIRTWGNGEIKFATSNGLVPGQGLPTERMRIDKSGNVGIGTSSPSATLHTSGTVRLQGLTSNSTLTNALVTDANGNVFTKDISSLGGSQWTNVTGGINYTGGRVGIGTNTPAHSLSIEKNAAYEDRGFLSLVNTDNSDYSQVVSGYASGTGSNQTALEVNVFAKSYYPSDFPHRSGTVMFRTNKMALVGKGADGYIAFRTGVNPNDLDAAAEYARIDANGYFGLGTTTPKAKLQITSGDVYLDDATKGIIMKNTSGQCYRITVGTAGALISTLITCP